jgi:hypothetical protein
MLLREALRGASMSVIKAIVSFRSSGGFVYILVVFGWGVEREI